MPTFISTTSATGQTVTSDALNLSAIVLTSGSTTSIVKVYGNGVELMRLSAVAGDSETYYDMRKMGKHIPGPVTLDLSGTLAFVALEY